ncbi:MAG: bifunctional UDP-sugar hydrolase/5'-nucleotidase [Cyanobacteria bacterium J06635_15]
MLMRNFIKSSALLAGSLSLLGGFLLTPAQAFNLSILHNNDGESQLLDDEGEAGAATFVTLINQVKADLTAAGTPFVTVSSGDNFLAGLAYEAGQGDFDAEVINAIDYDAIALGNHDFDFGSQVLADFIAKVDADIPYLSANLDFTGSPLEDLVGDRLFSSVQIEKDGEQIGIISAVTEGLASVSSPDGVTINPVKEAVEAEIAALEAEGVNKIILISHLQSINEEIALAEEVEGIDVIIAGGGDELLGDASTPLLSSEEGDEFFGPYPVMVNTEDGFVPVVTTPGEYKYLGQLNVTFDDDGNVTEANGQLIRNTTEDGLTPDPDIQANVIEPLEEAIAELEQNVVGTTGVFLNGVRGDVRTKETNLGNLIADALLWQAEQLADSFNAETPVIGIQNGGGIRNSNTFEVGEEISEADTINVLPFANFVTIVEDVTPEQLLAVFENAVSNVENVDGRFAQISGVKVGFDLESDPFSRVVSITLDDGTKIVENGKVAADAPTIALATNSFSARGGDDYPLGDNPQTNLPESYQGALLNYIVEELDGVVTAEDYPELGEGRLFAAQFVDEPVDGGNGGGGSASVPEPGTILGLLAVGALGAGAAKRRRQSA